MNRTVDEIRKTGEATQSVAPRSAGVARSASASARVVLIDDEREIARGLGIRLRAAGYDVTVAEDGLKGLAAITSTHPDLVLLDIRMPGMDGLSVLKRVRAQRGIADTPVVMLSASVGEQNGKRALDLGAQFIVEKPYEVKTLLAAMEAAMRKDHPETACPVQSTSRDETM